MSHKSEEQLAAIHRFETDYFPTLEHGIVSKDITQAMRHDWAILMAPPEIPLAVSVTDDVPLGNNPAEEAKIEAAMKFVGIRDEPTPKVGKGRIK